MPQQKLFIDNTENTWFCFGGVDIRNAPKLHAIGVNRFSVSEQQKEKKTNNRGDYNA
jgi:thiamine monophosphate synthase